MAIHPIDALEVCLHRGEFALEKVFPPATVEHLPSLVELISLRWGWWKTTGRDIFEVYPALSGHQAVEKLTRRAPRASLLGLADRTSHSGGTLAVWGEGAIIELPQEPSEWETGKPLSLALEEICQLLTKFVVSRRDALALMGATHELASNAVEHSKSAVAPWLSFEVSGTGWSLGITDVGQGVRASLRQNLDYGNLRTDQAALRLALQEGVSSTGEPGRGHGFRRVFQALVSRRVALRFRSGGAAGIWEGVSPTSQAIQIQSLPLRRGGFHVELSGALEVH